MLQNQRRHRILELVRSRKTCTLDELRQELGISTITLYRDLKKLHENDEICRIHGGVTLRSPDRIVSRFADRLSVNAAAKERIGRAVAEWIQEGSGIFVDASSTTYFFAQQIAQRRIARLALATNSLSIPLLFEACPQIRVISTGGELERTLNAYGGPIAMRVLEEMNFDAAYVSCAGFNLKHGATTDSPMLVEMLRGVVRHARKVVLLIDSSKFSRVAMMTALHASEITQIVTDDEVPHDVLHRLQDSGVDVSMVASDTPHLSTPGNFPSGSLIQP